ncbi:MAG: sulfatase family protein [Pirellula sp.]
MNTHPQRSSTFFGTIRTATACVWLALFGWVLVATSPVHAGPFVEGKTPNVVIILAEDFGFGSTNATGAPESLVRTPNIDRLFREGKRFTHAYTASSVCSPTRYALLTGRYAFRTSLKRGVLNPFAPLHVGTDQLNVASLLKKREYATAAIGKWHLGYGNGRSSDARTDYSAKLSPGPLEIGFDYHFGVPSNHGDLTGVFVENHYVYGLRGVLADNQARVGKPNADDDRFDTTYDAGQTEGGRRGGIEIDAPRRKNSKVMSVLTDKTVAWLDQQSAERPFFLYYTPVAVHNPVTPDGPLQGSSAAGKYGDWIHELDRSVGAVLDTLDRKGLSENTIVLFTSDNGGVYRPNNPELPQTQALEAGLKVNGALRGGKHTIFEGGFRVPYAVRWPGKIPAGSISEEPISLADTLATLAAVVDVPLESVRDQAPDSYNILPAWLNDGARQGIRREVLVHSADGVFAIRKGPWKWIEGVPAPGNNDDSRTRADNFQSQLYHLENDPSETSDVAGANPEVVTELRAWLDRIRFGGYSREVPSDQQVEEGRIAADPEARPKSIPPIAKVVAEPPKAPWTIARGTWVPRDGALLATPAGRQPAALSAPALGNNAHIAFDVRIGEVQRVTLRVDAADNKSFRFDVTADAIAIIKNDSDGPGPDTQEVWAQVPAAIARTEWHRVDIRLDGELAQLRVGNQVAEVQRSLVANEKGRWTWVVVGGTAELRDASINTQDIGSNLKDRKP